MDTFLRLWFGAVLLGCATFPLAARAEVAFDAGPSVAAPIVFAGGGGAVQETAWGLSSEVGWEHGRHFIGARTQAFFMPSATPSGFGATVSALYRLQMDLFAAFDPFLGLSGGVGMWAACFRGDFCGGGGPTGGLQLGVNAEPLSWLYLQFGGEMAVQFGLVNGVDFLLLPEAFASVGAHL